MSLPVCIVFDEKEEKKRRSQNATEEEKKARLCYKYLKTTTRHAECLPFRLIQKRMRDTEFRSKLDSLLARKKNECKYDFDAFESAMNAVLIGFIRAGYEKLGDKDFLLDRSVLCFSKSRTYSSSELVNGVPSSISLTRRTDAETGLALKIFENQKQLQELVIVKFGTTEVKAQCFQKHSEFGVVETKAVESKEANIQNLKLRHFALRNSIVETKENIARVVQKLLEQLALSEMEQKTARKFVAIVTGTIRDTWMMQCLHSNEDSRQFPKSIADSLQKECLILFSQPNLAKFEFQSWSTLLTTSERQDDVLTCNETVAMLLRNHPNSYFLPCSVEHVFEAISTRANCEKVVCEEKNTHKLLPRDWDFRCVATLTAGRTDAQISLIVSDEQQQHTKFLSVTHDQGINDYKYLYNNLSETHERSFYSTAAYYFDTHRETFREQFVQFPQRVFFFAVKGAFNKLMADNPEILQLFFDYEKSLKPKQKLFLKY